MCLTKVLCSECPYNNEQNDSCLLRKDLFYAYRAVNYKREYRAKLKKEGLV